MKIDGEELKKFGDIPNTSSPARKDAKMSKREIIAAVVYIATALVFLGIILLIPTICENVFDLYGDQVFTLQVVIGAALFVVLFMDIIVNNAKNEILKRLNIDK